MLDQAVIVLAIAFDMPVTGPFRLLQTQDRTHPVFRFLPIECHTTYSTMLAIEGYFLLNFSSP